MLTISMVNIRRVILPAAMMNSNNRSGQEEPSPSTKRQKTSTNMSKNKEMKEENAHTIDDLNEERLEEIKQDQAKLENFVKSIQTVVDDVKAGRSQMTFEIFELGELMGSAKSHLKALQEKALKEPTIFRVAKIDYGLKDSEMSYMYDLDQFESRVNDLFDWFENENYKRFMAPYFPLIQSSGMGKTKLLYEFCRRTNERSTPREALLVLCEPFSQADQSDIDDDQGVFKMILSVPQGSNLRDAIVGQLDTFLSQSQNPGSGEVVMLFDEAQALLVNEGLAFRCVRWWLRRWRDRKIVAVFAGTTSKLSNFFKEDKPTMYSRSGEANIYRNDGDGATHLYEPFYEICTIGLFSVVTPPANAEKLDHRVDVQSAARFGRPLFAHMALKGHLNEKALTDIRTRMLVEQGDPSSQSKELVCMSILGARCQLGQTTLHFASNLVSRGYASLTHFSQGVYEGGERSPTAEIAFFPDPVCAHLAMTLMSSNSLISGSEDPYVWTERASALFSHGLCRPHKGDVGEVAAALYLLFCGDVLRKSVDIGLTRFEVPLSKWLSLLARPALSLAAGDVVSPDGPCISFIQVCRNYLRHSVEALSTGRYLQDWYEAGCAFYSYPGCPAYDLIAPVRYKDKAGMTKYCPMLVSIKNRQRYPNGEANAALESMKRALSKVGISVGVCLLLLIGSSEETSWGTNVENIDCMDSLAEGNIILAKIAVPESDCFGCWNLAVNSSTGGGERAEVYTSHFVVHQSSAEMMFLQQDVTGTKTPPFEKLALLRDATKKAAPSRILLNGLLTSFRKSFETKPK